MFRTLFRRFYLTVGGLTFCICLAHAPNPLIAAFGWLLFAYLVACAWPVMRGHAAALAGVAKLRRPGGRFRRSARFDGGTL